MQKNRKKLFTKIKITCVAIIIMALAAGSTSYLALAGGTSGPGGPVGGGGCKMSGSGTWVDTCFGGMWKYYPTTENYIHVDGTKSGNVPGGDIIGCGTYGGYYRLALERFHLDSYSGTGVQVGLVRVDQFTLGSSGGKVAYRLGDKHWAEIRQKFETAKKKYNLPTAWEETGYFCWDDDWCDPTKEICDTVEPDPGEGNGYFWADSTVEVDAQNDVPHIGPYTSDAEDKKAYVTFSTDKESVKVKFYHKLHYVLKEKPTANPDSWDSDTFTEDIYTDWNVSGAGTGSGKWSLTGTDPKDNKDSDKLIEKEFEVKDLKRGETRLVCQKISYTPKSYEFKTVLEHTHTDHSGDTTNPDGSTNHGSDTTVHDSWDWGVDSSSGSGFSEACAIIYRPPDSVPDPYDPGTAGNGESDIMYAGEDTSMTWGTTGETAFTRRLINWKSILYLINEGELYDISKVKGNNRTIEPCSYYNGKTNNYYCKDYEGGGISYPSSYSYYKQNQFAVADYVGAKFCLSFGYQYEYRWSYSTNYDGSFPAGNLSAPYSQYWRTYNSSCRTIAKKPSSAIWNGSLMTNGGIYTPLSAYRHDSGEMNNDWRNSGFSERTLYGSWTEHLDVVKNSIDHHASGSTLALGSKRNGDDFCNNTIASSNTTLTISNNNCNNLGHSGINNNSAYLTKLTTYLRDDPKIRTGFTYIDHQSSDNVMAQLGENMSGTTIVRHSGDLNITHDITTNKGPYSNIYQIPQVIIFVDGNVNISSNVERIDAWLIVRDAIDTCTAFNDGTTAAHVNAKPTDICSHQLTFNGPVRADNIKLRRSFGANNIHSNLTGSPLPGRMATEKWAPAEIFNLRADTYLWAYAQAGRYDSSYTESYSRELPPRYQETNCLSLQIIGRCYTIKQLWSNDSYAYVKNEDTKISAS